MSSELKKLKFLEKGNTTLENLKTPCKNIGNSSKPKTFLTKISTNVELYQWQLLPGPQGKTLPYSIIPLIQ